MTRWRLGLAAVLGLALALRLWAFRHGLPFAYTSDEAQHFVPKAVRFFEDGYDPHYFKNPPAFTYLVHGLLRIRYAGDDPVAAFKADPTGAYELGRLASAVLGVIGVWLVYALGARLFDRRVGLLAAAVMATAFLPVFYSHLALNDVPATVPLTASLFGSAGVLLHGRRIDWALAGAGLGLGAATKYTAGIALVPLIAAAAYQLAPVETRRVAIRGAGLAAIAAGAVFFAANPYALLDPHVFLHELRAQSSLTQTQKLGLPHESGYRYYLWALTWGFGWVPAVAAAGGGAVLALADRRRSLLLLPAPLLFYVYLGSHERFFGRWLLPVVPILAVLAAYAVVRLADALGRRGRLFALGAGVSGALALVAQSLVYAVHNDLVLSRPDTRTLTRAWMIENIPRGSDIVLEPVASKIWVRDTGGQRYWQLNRWSFGGEDYVRRLTPALVDDYARAGACWVVTASTVAGRALADPEAAPAAIRYYRRLEQRSHVEFRASPFESGARPVPFNFDWSFDYYPLAYRRPGPVMTVHMLTGTGCG